MPKRQFPEHIELELTNACNMRCKMCPRTQMQRPVRFMPLVVFKKVVNECRGRGTTTYLHQFGEPLLHPQLLWCIEYAAEAGMRTSLSTNCSMLKGVLSTALAHSRLDEIVLCLDSLQKEVYESLRIGGVFEEVYQNIRNFLDTPGRKVKAVVQIIDTLENHEELQHFKMEGCDEILIKPYTNWAGRLEGDDLEDRLQCNKLDRCLTIQANGDTVLCCRDLEGTTRVGNVLTHTVQELWNSYGELNPITFPFCAKC